MSDDARPLSADEIAEIGARAEAATPGPWKHVAGTLKHYVASDEPGEELGFSLQELHWEDGRLVPAEANARFIAHARTDIPRLLATLRSRDQEIAGLRKLARGAATTPPDHDKRAACRQRLINEGRCLANNDGECDWLECPQLRDRQPSCPRYEETRRRLDAEDDGR